MSKKTIISKTILFIFILTFISIFKALFGEENLLIGVTVITATLMLLERDLTISPIKNLLNFSFINVLLGLLAFLANQNMYMGIFINFIAMFIVSYLFSYDLRKPIYVAFGLQYLFMLTSPVDINSLSLRLMSLVFGAAFIMATQLLVNKNKLKKVSDKNLRLICEELLNKIELLRDNKSFNMCDDKIDLLAKELKIVIYDNRKDDFYITERGISIINITLSLERINLILNRYKDGLYKGPIIVDNNKSNNKEEVLDLLHNSIENIKLFIEGNSNLEESLLNIKECIKKENTNDINIYEIQVLLENIQEYLYSYKSDKIENDQKQKIEIPPEFKTLSVHKRNLNIKSLRFSYALKVSIGIAISGLILDILKIPESRWIMFTVFSLVRPYTENSIIKSRKRLQGTLIGTLLFIVLFNVITDMTLRGIILLIAGYLNTYMVDYKNLVICITVSSLGAASMMSDPNTVAFARIGYVFIGIVISLIINKVILPYDARLGYKYILDMYKAVAQKMVKEVNNYINGNENKYNMKNLLLISTLIEDRLLMINTVYKDKTQDEFIKNQKLLISNMYHLFVNIKNNTVKDEDIEMILTDADYISNYEASRYDEAKKVILEGIYNTEYIGDKVICINLLEILNGINKMYEIK